MFDQITTLSANKNIYAPFQSNGAPYAIIKSSTSETQKSEDNSNKEKKSNALGYEIAMTALIAGVAVLTLTKGLPKPLRLQVEKFSSFLDKKVQALKATPHLSTIQEIYLSTLEKSKNLATKSKVLFDTATIKDNLLHSALKRIPILDKFDRYITTKFRNVSIMKYENAYSSSLVRFDRMYADFAELNEKIKNKDAEKALKSLKKSYDGTFSATVRRKRLNDTIKDLSGLDDDVLSILVKPKDYIKDKFQNQTFISEEKAAPMKKRLDDKITEARIDVDSFADELMEIYNQAMKKGEISPKDYERIVKSKKRSYKALNRATDIEKDKLFDKLRDLAIGSAPMDVLGILTSVGVIGWQLQKAEDKDEKISIALKSGIPIIGGMCVSLFCAIALVSTGPSLILGFASGLAINKLGSAIDKYRKEKIKDPWELAKMTLPEGLMPIKNAEYKKSV